ncbi:hypothetical protein [Nesterenkonia flava]|uniref:Type II secretion system protein GspF domain-containing protein n=1 Tax=Nesterenkonia flava TaxID=469799 RepID=A0ABU1FQF8_9MICC|nr:hypothetical protein [Nesterenkonia flava]MDR5710858.1 hypothetical protein [Nesterenkonia flava]
MLKVLTGRQLKRARTVERLVAARSVLESPQQMWKQIGGVSITTYAGVVGINQSAQVLDRRHLYVSLHKVGMSRAQLQRIRTLAVMRSLGIVVTIALLAAAVTAFPIIGLAVLSAPATVATALAVLALGVGAVYGGVHATRSTLARVVPA